MKENPVLSRAYNQERLKPVATKDISGQVGARARARRNGNFLLLSGFWLNLALVLNGSLGLAVYLATPNINSTALAQVVTPAPLENSAYDGETFKVADQLQCPVCQGVTVAYSNSGLAQQMRVLIKKKLEAGETKEQILQYFVDRYGESILTNPPKSGFTLLVWLLPVAGLLVGAGTVGYALRSWKARVRAEARPAQSGPGGGEASDVAGNFPSKIEEGARPDLPGGANGTGLGLDLDVEKLQEYHSRVEAELAAFAKLEEWDYPPPPPVSPLPPLPPVEPALANQLSLSRSDDPARLSEGKEENKTAAEGLN